MAPSLERTGAGNLNWRLLRQTEPDAEGPAHRFCSSGVRLADVDPSKTHGELGEVRGHGLCNDPPSTIFL